MTDTAAANQAGTEPIIKAKDVSYIRFSAPDLDVMEQFVRDFGLVVVHRDDDVLYSRGLEGTPFLHAVHRGPPKFLGFSFVVDSEDDLQSLADNVDGCTPVHDITGIEGELGGGRRVHFIEPNTGVVIEAVHGHSAEPLTARRDRITYNHGGIVDRMGEMQDVSNNRNPNSTDPGPPEIVRLGHVVIIAPMGAHQKFMRFLAETFGMLISDAFEMRVPPGEEDKLPPPLREGLAKCESSVMLQFMRMDRGEQPTDHHSVLALPLMDPRAAHADGTLHAQLSHAAFEVFSMDDVFRGHMSMRAKNEAGNRYALAWGVGRHVYGSQVYDYWHDPYGHVHEHMCDGDIVDSSFGPNLYDMSALGTGGGNQWGPTVTESGVFNLDGPQCSPHFAELPAEDQASLLSRDLSGVQNIIDSL